MTSTRHTPFFFKNSFYINIEAEICEISRINPRMRGIKFEKDIILCVENVNNMLLTKTYKIIAFSQWQKVFPPPTPQKSKEETCTSYIQVFNANEIPMNGTIMKYICIQRI